jgi:hypothetical protein
MGIHFIYYAFIRQMLMDELSFINPVAWTLGVLVGIG